MIEYVKQSFFFGVILKFYELIQNSVIFRFANIKARGKKHIFLVEHSFYYRIIKTLGKKIDGLFEFLNGAYERSFFSMIVKKWLSITSGSFIIKKLKEKSGLESFGSFFLVIPVCYMLSDFIIRRTPIISKFGSVWDELFLIFLFMYAFAKRVFNRKIKSRQTVMGLPTLLLIITGISCLLVKQPNLDIAIEGFRAMFQQLLWYFIFSFFIREEKEVKFFTSVLSMFGLFLGLHACYQFVRGVPMPGNWTDVTESVRTRAFSIAGSPNILGAMFVCLIPISFSKIFETRGFRRMLNLTSCISMLLGLVFTFSRGAWLSFIIVLAVFILILNFRLIVPFGFSGLIVLLTNNPISRRFLHLFTPYYQDRSGAGGRIYRWGVGLKTWERSKMFGVGLGRFGGAVAINNNLCPFYLDNYYLKTLVETGIFGLSFLLIYIIWFLIFGWKVIDSQKTKGDIIRTACIFSGGCGVLLQNLVENIFEVPAMMVIFFLAVSLLETLRVKEKLE